MFFGIAYLDEAQLLPVIIPVRFLIPVVHQSDMLLHLSFPTVERETVTQHSQKTFKTVKPRVFDGVVVIAFAL